MSVFKSDYDTTGTFTITLASLTNTSVRAGTAIDNTTSLYLDAVVQLLVKTGGSSTSASGFLNIYAFGTANPSGPTYPEGITGTDGGITLTVPTNLKLIGTINAVANATSYTSEPMSVAAAFGGVLPQKWGIAVENQTGGTLDSTSGNFAAYYQGIWGQSV